MKRIAILLAAIVASLCSMPQLAAQAVEVVVLSGLVKASTGEAIPGAAVSIVNDATGTIMNQKSNATGAFQALVPFGTYSITFQAEGFQANIVRRIEVSKNVVVSPAMVPLPPRPAAAMAIQNEPTSKAHLDFVQVGVNGVLGPMGYVATPSLSSASQLAGTDAEALLASKNFNFPSITLYISTAPLVYTPADLADSNNLDKIQSAQETTANPLWLDATFTLTPRDDAGNLIPSACTDGSVQVLGILPQQTAAAAKESLPGAILSGITDTAGAVASLSAANAGMTSAATQAMNVAFNDIFPPHPIAYQYSYLHGNCDFGWFFRPNTSGTAGAGPASILGLQTGIILLKTTRNIGQIGVEGRTLSEWNKAPSNYSKKLFASTDTLPTFILPDPADINFDRISDLTAFPALIPKKQAMAIAHITTDADWQTFVKTAPLATTPAGDYVTNASLAAFLTAKQPLGTTAPPPTPTPAPAAKPEAPTPKPQPIGKKTPTPPTK